jgi:hypothetical protein
VCRQKTRVVHFLPLRKMKEKQAVQDLFYFIGVEIKKILGEKPLKNCENVKKRFFRVSN